MIYNDIKDKALLYIHTFFFYHKYNRLVPSLLLFKNIKVKQFRGKLEYFVNKKQKKKQTQILAFISIQHIKC